jgi:hypothetical protein
VNRRRTLLGALLLAACSSAGPARNRALPPPEYEAPRPFPSTTATTEPDTEDDVPSAPTADEELQTIGAEFLEAYFKLNPVRATEAGDHRFDDRWPDMSEQGERAMRATLEATQKRLLALPDDKLSAENAVDKSILLNHIALSLFAMDETKPASTDPMLYTALLGDGLDPLLNRNFAPPATRAKSLVGRLESVGPIVRAAKARLSGPSALHTQTAIDQNKGLVELCKTGFANLAKEAGAEGPKLLAAAQKAEAALIELGDFFEKDLAKRANGEVRLGQARFEKKLALVLDDPDAKNLVADARALLESTRKEMVLTAKELWPELMKGKKWKEPTTTAEERKVVKQILDELAKDTSTNATIVKDIEATLASATEFVRKHDLVRIPDEPCKIVEMPEYRRGVAVAYCDSSGPLETKPETFYAISPTPKDWPKKRVESFYREYNRAMLHDLTVHEAMPGHFLQAMHQNRFPSKVRAVLWHGAFVEGWAVYTEWLMAKYGFGGAKVRMQRQKMVLRMAANTILDHGVHAGGMTEKEALALMKDEAFQEEGEAVGKWKRAQLTSAQLTTYFYGFKKMMELRAAAEKGAWPGERKYHDELLAHGSPAPRYLPRVLKKP